MALTLVLIFTCFGSIAGAESKVASTAAESNDIYSKVTSAQVQTTRSKYNELKQEFPEAEISVEKMLEFQYTLSQMAPEELAEYIKEVYSEGPVAVYINREPDGSYSQLEVFSVGLAQSSGWSPGTKTVSGSVTYYTGSTVYVHDLFGILGLGISYKIDHRKENGYGVVTSYYTASVSPGLPTPFNIYQVSAPVGSGINTNVVYGTSNCKYLDQVNGFWINMPKPTLSFTASTLAVNYSVT